MARTVEIAELMETSGVQFGTSGARGLVSAMTDEVCYAYAAAFLQYLLQNAAIAPGSRVAVAGDRRSSTGRILNAVVEALLHSGFEPVDAGRVPSPALALYGLERRIPTLMVTGSHIPDDRNGIKFNTPRGEVLKSDEAGIKAQRVLLPDIFDAGGALRSASRERRNFADEGAARGYVQHFLRAFPKGVLAGSKIGLYGHSAVGRELLDEILTGLGASVTRLGFCEEFVPVDTEAIRPEDRELARGWANEYGFHAIVSTDGDSDRPLISDETGRFLRGDIAGILTARYLRAEVVVTPVSSNSAVERCGAFRQVLRTRIGSPYVIEAMQELVKRGESPVGYEANGGFLTATESRLPGGTLSALLTRDPVIVILSILASAAEGRRSVASLLDDLPARFTASERLAHFPTELSRNRLQELERGGQPRVAQEFAVFGPVASIDSLDGLRISFSSGEIVHLRASGNAPELRCYTEAETEARAWELNRLALACAERWRAAQ